MHIGFKTDHTKYKKTFFERRKAMIYCGCTRCDRHEYGLCKEDSININSYGRCNYFCWTGDGVEELICYIELYFKEYPFRWDKDKAFFQQLLDEFPHLDVLDQLKRFRIWLMDREDCKGRNLRSRFRNWLVRANEKECVRL